MYTVDSKDRVLPLTAVPQSSVGAPLPCIVANEQSLLIAYIVIVPDEHWDGQSVRTVDASSPERVAIVQMTRPHAHMFGPPNDEAFAGHPLAARGLEPYGAYEVAGSSWIRRLEQMNSVHHHHNPRRFAELRHFILSFHDSTFECAAHGVEVVEVGEGTMLEAAGRMCAMLAN